MVSREGTPAETAELCGHKRLATRVRRAANKPKPDLSRVRTTSSLSSSSSPSSPMKMSSPNTQGAAVPSVTDVRAFRSFDELNSLSMQGSNFFPTAWPQHVTDDWQLHHTQVSSRTQSWP